MKFFRKFIIFILILLVAFGGYVAGAVIITKKPPKVLELIFPPQTKTVAVMGMDGGGTRSDVLMVGFLNGVTGEINLISIPRDTRVLIDGSYHKINSAYALGGAEKTIEVLENLLDIKIDNYVKFSFDAFSETIDALGGVEFDVPQDMFYEDPYQDLYIDLKAGMQHLDGEKAQQLVRYRRYPTGDEGRIAVQQDFMRELVKQNLNFKTLLKMPKIINTVMKHIETNVPESDYIPLALTALKAADSEIKTHKLPGGAKRIGLSYYIADLDETAELIEEITGQK